MLSCYSDSTVTEISSEAVDNTIPAVPEGEAGCSEDAAEGVAGTKIPECEHCKDKPRRKCKFCACAVCGGKDSPDKQLLCDDCDMAYHLWCLTPKLDAVPEQDYWYGLSIVTTP